jgi:4-amino-4-deoxy-L-arabinose transferase-like glycosyltransferase
LIMSRSSAVALAVFIFFIAVHLYYLSSPFVSLEFAYGRSALRLMKGGMGPELNRFLELVANPLSSLFTIVPFYFLFGFSEFITRFPSFLSGVGLVILVFIMLRRLKGSKRASLAVVTILLNPMYWACSGLAYTDIPFCLFSGGGLLFCVLGLYEDKPVLHWPAAFFLSLSALIKYNGLLFFPLAAVLIIVHLGKRAPRHFIPYAVLAVLMDLPVYLVILNRYGFLVHPRLRVLHRPRPDRLYLYIPSYLLWLGLFMGPFLAFPVCDMLARAGRKAIPWLLLVVLLCVVCGLLGWGGAYLARLHETGEYEMGAAWFEILLGESALAPLVLLVLALAVVSAAGIIAWMGRGRVNLFFGIWLFSIFIIGSVSRPANRYLLFILVPLSVYLSDVLARLDETSSMKWPLRTYFFALLAVLALVCFFPTSL